MKTTRLITLFAAAGLVFAACEKPETEDKTVAVESVSLDKAISEGYELTEGTTLDISEYVTVLPENATDKTVSYSSSKTDIATVSEEGVITAVAEGETEITVKAGDKTATFTLTVKAKPAETVAVESITLDDSIKDGATLEAGETLSIAGLVTVLPDNATDKTVTYGSSDEKVATISEAGLITALSEGPTTISVSAGDKTVKFILTVTAKSEEPVEITEITISESTLSFEMSADAQPVDLMQYITVTPENHTGTLTFSSSSQTVATVDAEGMLTLVGAGETTVTVAAEDNPSVSATVTIVVSGDYDRSGWSMTCSQNPLPNLSGRNNSLTAMLDGNPDSVFCITRPGKKTGGVNLSGVDADTYQIDFTIDMGTVQTINYFRLDHLSANGPDLGTRMAGFTQILGSKNGSEFSPIAENVDFAEHARVLANTSTENIAIPATECRYVKFVMIGIGCYDPGVNSETGADTNNGNSAQIKELYLGYKAE